MPKRPPKKARQVRRGPHGAYLPEKKDAFLAAFAEHGFLLRAAKAVGIDRQTVYNWLKDDEAFRARFQEADDAITEICEGAAMQRAVQGVRKAILYQGTQVKDRDGNPMYERIYSDYLLGMILKARSDKYKEHVKHEIDQKIVRELSSEFLAIFKRHIPECCPNCKTNLGLTPRIAQDLIDLSARLGKTS